MGGSRPSSVDGRAGSEGSARETGPPKQLRELYKRAKLLFDLSASSRSFALSSRRLLVLTRTSQQSRRRSTASSARRRRLSGS